MIRLFPLIFVLLWSSAFITTKPIVDYSDPFAALAFRFSIVAFGFFLFSFFKQQKILVPKKNAFFLTCFGPEPLKIVLPLRRGDAF